MERKVGSSRKSDGWPVGNRSSSRGNGTTRGAVREPHKSAPRVSSRTLQRTCNVKDFLFSFSLDASSRFTSSLRYSIKRSNTTIYPILTYNLRLAFDSRYFAAQAHGDKSTVTTFHSTARRRRCPHIRVLIRMNRYLRSLSGRQSSCRYSQFNLRPTTSISFTSSEAV